MHEIILFTLALHVLSGVFWGGSTFVMARTGKFPGRLVGSQIGASVVAIFSGGALFLLLHAGTPGTAEHVLGVGATAAILAAVTQAIVVGRAARMLPLVAPEKIAGLESRMAVGQRVAAPLLALTIVCMATARFI
jgi:hypothetical protein